MVRAECCSCWLPLLTRQFYTPSQKHSKKFKTNQPQAAWSSVVTYKGAAESSLQKHVKEFLRARYLMFTRKNYRLNKRIKWHQIPV